VPRKYAIHPGQGQLEFGWPAEDEAVCEPPGWPRHRGQCHWETQYGTRCGRIGSDALTGGFYLCTQHEQKAEGYAEEYFRNDPRLITKLYWDAVGGPGLDALPAPGRSVVYFVERQGFVKIGTSTNLEQRLRDIGKGGQMIEGMTVGPVRLLATMPGDHRHEKLLHERFHRLRVEGEWFLPDIWLCEFIRRMPNVDRDLLEEVEIRHGLADEEAS